MRIYLKDVKNNEKVKIYIKKADDYLDEIGYTEHGFRHVGITADLAFKILKKTGFPKREVELAAIAGWMHDMGNFLGRENHPQNGAILAMRVLEEMDGDMNEIVAVGEAIANHEEPSGIATNPITAAVVLADKADVHRSRVRNSNPATFDIHDRVNFAVVKSNIFVDQEKKEISLNLNIDTKICQVMEFFEIFLTRMVMCRKAASVLDYEFRLEVNKTKLS